MFNAGLDKLINAYNSMGLAGNIPLTKNHARILYKGGNVIATYTKLFLDKLQRSQKRPNPRFFDERRQELKHGDWNYTLALDHSLLGSIFDRFTRTLTLYMLQGVKDFMDSNDIFQMQDVAAMIQRDLLNSNDGRAIIEEYRRSTNTEVSLESINNPTHLITAVKIQPMHAPDLYSKMSLKREYSPNITDSYEVHSLVGTKYPMLMTGISIGFVERLQMRKTYLISDFDLARVKINNRAKLKINGKIIEKNLSADLIDMSFINTGDTKSESIHSRLDKIGKSEWTMRRVDKYDIPYLSPHYLFYDLNNMLIEEGVYM